MLTRLAMIMTVLFTNACTGAEITIALKGLSPGESVTKVEVLKVRRIARNGTASVPMEEAYWEEVHRSNWRANDDSTILYLASVSTGNFIDERIRITVHASSKSAELSLAVRAPYTAILEPPKPNRRELENRGVDPLLAQFGVYDHPQNKFLVPGYEAVPVAKVSDKTLGFPSGAYFIPRSLTLATKGVPSNWVKDVIIKFRNTHIKVSVDGSLSVRKLLCDLARQGEDLNHILAEGVTVSPALPQHYQRLYEETIDTLSSADLMFPTKKHLVFNFQPARLRLRVGQAADSELALLCPTFSVPSGKQGEWTDIPFNRLEDGWEIMPASSRLHAAPEKVRIDFGSSFESQTIQLPVADWRNGLEINSPRPKGWFVSSSRPVPGGTLFRVSLPGSADVWMPEFDPRTNVLQLPRGKAWEELRGATIEVRSPNAAPVFLNRVEGQTLSLPDTGIGPPYPQKTFVVLNNQASVVAASPSSENRIRQLQSEIVRQLVLSLKDNNLNYLATIRVKEGMGNWSHSASDVLVMKNGALPFDQVGMADDSGLARTLRRMAESAPSPQLHIVVVTPNCLEERATHDTQWLKTSLAQLTDRLSVHTIVADASVQLNQQTLQERYVNPIHAKASFGVNLFDEADRIVREACEVAGIQTTK